MMNFFSQSFSILTSPAGSITFHLFLVATLAGAFQASYFHWRLSAFPQTRRTLIGLVILIIPQILLFLISGLGSQGVLNLDVFLPPLDRAITLISLIWIIWLWVFPEPSRNADTVTVTLTLLVLAALVLGLLTRGQQPAGTPYNTTPQEIFWQVASIGMICLGFLLLFIRQPNGWENGLTVLLLAFLGHVLQLIFGRATGNYPGTVRLGYMAMYPFLFTLPQRFPATIKPKPVPAPIEEAASEKEPKERRRYSTDPKTFHALLDLAAAESAEKISHAITHGIAQTMLADLCFLLYLTDNKNQLVVASGYDLIREENLEGTSLSKNSIPMLTNAIQRGRPLRMPASSTSADIKGLKDLLGLNNPGHILSVPIVTPNKEILGGILVLSPYSERVWKADDQSFLINIANGLVPVLQRNQHLSGLEQKQQQAENAVEDANDHLRELDSQNQALKKQIKIMKQEAESRLNQDSKSASLLKLQQETQQKIDDLQKENEQLRASLIERDDGTPNDANKIQSDLRMSLEKISQLQGELAQAKKDLSGVAGEQSSNRSPEQAEVIASISQELRQPMSSIVGYTDLLLGESVGILGTLQRKFVERIKASTERIGSLMEDMIQLTTIESGLADLRPEPVDLNSIIDNAMSYTSSQIREKNISLHLDLPKDVQSIYADREALQQILIHLLQNAGAVSPIEGTITLKVQTRTEEDHDYVVLQVADTGGGIPSDDIPRVFTRLYRANNVLIQGLGDTGVGLSIAKTLTEAQNGRIWVESDPGVGSTFSVLLPMNKGN